MSAHYVYRCYGADGDLLYVGSSRNVPGRLAQHQAKAFWSLDVVKVKASVYRSEFEARAAERHAIRNENPRYNVLGRWVNRALWTERDYVDYVRVLLHGGSWHTPIISARMQTAFAEFAARFGKVHPLTDAANAMFTAYEKRRTS